ncbi:endonuclease [Myroides sp. BIT-d1]|uniref:Endonuclease n=1 Tax=Myroides albus TaxID=2562892 RepID=A0A6I3LLY3_9FLAO|nr:YraN family protein [Myroides albus]MTG97561.1 endonuclease [Myroides albus]
MAEHNELGKLGEELAVEYLERNWRFQDKEIDIIALYNGVLVFIEVKTRSSLEFGLPQEFVKRHKIKRLLTAADAYIELNSREEEVRFDIIAIHAVNNEFSIDHLEDAFYFF